MMMPATLRNWLDTRAYRLRAPRHGPLVLGHRRVYILPVSHGYVFVAVLLIMLAGSINYSLSLGFVLTFLLVGLGINGMLYTFRNLANLRLMAGRPRSIFVGQSAEFPLRIENPTPVARAAIEVSHPGVSAQSFDVPAQGEITVSIPLPATRRGLLPLGRVMLLTRFPLGIFRAWSYAQFDVDCIVFAMPESPAVPLPAPAGERGEGAASALGNEDYAGLRPYHAGDSLRRIAWKADAREQGLLTKIFTGRSESHLWLEWSKLPHALDTEARLSRLTRWVLDADQVDAAYGLKLPGITIEPATGIEHRTRCLETLALYDHERAARPA